MAATVSSSTSSSVSRLGSSSVSVSSSVSSVSSSDSAAGDSVSGDASSRSAVTSSVSLTSMTSPSGSPAPSCWVLTLRLASLSPWGARSRAEQGVDALADEEVQQRHQRNHERHEDQHDKRVGDQLLPRRPDDLAELGDDLTEEAHEPLRQRDPGRTGVAHRGGAALARRRAAARRGTPTTTVGSGARALAPVAALLALLRHDKHPPASRRPGGPPPSFLCTAWVAGATGLEPATCGFGDRCSAN